MTTPVSLDIIIVDDESVIRDSLTDHLSRCGHDVRQAGDVRHFFAAWADETADVVLLDIRLPDGDGLDVLERLRTEAPELPKISSAC